MEVNTLFLLTFTVEAPPPLDAESCRKIAPNGHLMLTAKMSWNDIYRETKYSRNIRRVIIKLVTHWCNRKQPRSHYEKAVFAQWSDSVECSRWVVLHTQYQNTRGSESTLHLANWCNCRCYGWTCLAGGLHTIILLAQTFTCRTERTSRTNCLTWQICTHVRFLSECSKYWVEWRE